MKLFKCQSCGQALYFENTRCERCGHRLGYLPDLSMLSAVEQDGNWWQPLASPEQPRRFCANAELDVCNWTVPADSAEDFCAACRHNRMVPDISFVDNLAGWRKLEGAKHRLFYTLVRFGLPLRNRVDDPVGGLAFDFPADSPGLPLVLTGHEDGLITIALKEADDAEREGMRKRMGEPYRTLLGHFRHEIGHYFWDKLVEGGGMLEACRTVFGDDTRDYEEALRTHYAQGAPPGWQENYVSAYATSHPWEDFAETWAHYLHIVDTLETAGSFGMEVHPKLDESGVLHAEVDFDPYKGAGIGRIVDSWLPLAFAVNSLNRSMGQPDLYPFVLSPAVITKLGFIHQLVHSTGDR